MSEEEVYYDYHQVLRALWLEHFKKIDEKNRELEEKVKELMDIVEEHGYYGECITCKEKVYYSFSRDYSNTCLVCEECDELFCLKEECGDEKFGCNKCITCIKCGKRKTITGCVDKELLCLHCDA